MKEIGIDISKYYLKSVSDLPADFIDTLAYVITLCAEEVCPMIVSSAKKIHWSHPDTGTKEQLPEAEILWRFRQARDAIYTRLKEFKKEIGH